MVFERFKRKNELFEKALELRQELEVADDSTFPAKAEEFLKIYPELGRSDKSFFADVYEYARKAKVQLEAESKPKVETITPKEKSKIITSEEKKLNYLAGKSEESVKSLIGDIFSERFLTEEPPFHNLAHKDFIRDYFAIRRALDTFYDINRGLKGAFPEDPKLCKRWIDRALDRISEPIDALTGDRSNIVVQNYWLNVSKDIELGTAELNNMKNISKELNDALSLAQGIVSSYQEKINEMMAQEPKKADAYFKTSEALRGVKNVMNTLEKELNDALEKIDYVHKVRTDPRAVKEYSLDAFDGFGLLNSRLKDTFNARDIYLDHVRAFDQSRPKDQSCYEHMNSVYNALKNLIDVSAKIVEVNKKIKAVEAPQIKAVSARMRSNFMKLNKEFPLLSEYKKVLKYGEALKDIVSKKLA